MGKASNPIRLMGGTAVLWLILLCVLAACLLRLPVTFTVLSVSDPQWLVTLAWQAGPLRFRQQRIYPPPPGRSASPDLSRMALLTNLRRSSSLRRIQKHIRLRKLEIRASLFLPDAARTAQLCGMLNTLPVLLPRSWLPLVSIGVTPDFWSGRQHVAAECIFSLRLGMLMADAVRLLMAIRRQRQRPPKEG